MCERGDHEPRSETGKYDLVRYERMRREKCGMKMKCMFTCRGSIELMLNGRTKTKHEGKRGLIKG